MIRSLIQVSALAVVICGAESAFAEPIDVNGSTTVAPVVVRAAEVLAVTPGLQIRVDTQGGSSGGIAALGRGRTDIAMTSRPLSGRDREKFPEVDFRPVQVGVDAVAIVVSPDVWHAGVRSISRTQMQAIYEKRATNWSDVGGPDQPIVFFNKEPGRGTWEVFADWLYGDVADAPLVSHREVGSNEEARTKVAATQGAMTQLSAAWADGERVFALALEDASGTHVGAGAASLAAGTYPMVRPLLVVTDGVPESGAEQLIHFLLGAEGRAIVRDAGYLAPDVGSGPPAN